MMFQTGKFTITHAVSVPKNTKYCHDCFYLDERPRKYEPDPKDAFCMLFCDRVVRAYGEKSNYTKQGFVFEKIEKCHSLKYKVNNYV